MDALEQLQNKRQEEKGAYRNQQREMEVSACPAYNPGSAFLLSAGDTSTVSRKIQRTPQEKQFPIPQNTGYLPRIRHRGKA